MKSRRLRLLLKNSLGLGVSLFIGYGCQGSTVYHAYQAIDTEGWDKRDTLTYTLPSSVTPGTYEAQIGLRYQDAYPYRDIWLGICHNLEDSLTYTTDTLHLFLADPLGNRSGNRPSGLYQSAQPYRTTLHIQATGSSRSFRIIHLMKDQSLPGIHDVGIELDSKH